MRGGLRAGRRWGGKSGFWVTTLATRLSSLAALMLELVSAHIDHDATIAVSIYSSRSVRQIRTGEVGRQLASQIDDGRTGTQLIVLLHRINKDRIDRYVPANAFPAGASSTKPISCVAEGVVIRKSRPAH